MNTIARDVKPQASSLLTLFMILAFSSAGSKGQWLIQQAEKQKATAAVTRLDLSAESGLRGDQVFLSIALTRSPGVKTRSTQNEIIFPSRLVRFVNAIEGRATKEINGKMNVQVAADPNDREKSRLTLEVSLDEETAGVESIPDGVIANLTFEITMEAKEGSMIVLHNIPRAWAKGKTTQKVGPVNGSDGKITVTGTALPMSGCFFYMH